MNSWPLQGNSCKISNNDYHELPLLGQFLRSPLLIVLFLNKENRNRPLRVISVWNKFLDWVVQLLQQEIIVSGLTKKQLLVTLAFRIFLCFFLHE